MKKTIAVILTLCMLLGLCSFSAFAAEATVGTVAADYKPAEGAVAVTNEAEFLAMAADGNYYLANDITVSKTYAQAAFKGTFDGCGKTVTISTPLFANLGGTVKNLTIKGEVTAITKDGEQGDGGHMAAIACYSSKKDTIVIENVCNNANISGGETSGGLYGYVRDGSDLTVKNCVNNGTINGTGQTAGMVGYCQGKIAVFENCVNNGTITTTSYGAGIISRFGKNASADTEGYSITVTNCVNNASITSGKDQTAGILAYTTAGSVTISNCHNKGNIDLSAVTESINIGGILGSSKSQQSSDYFKQKVTITECTNTGNLKGINLVGGIAAYARAKGEVGEEVYTVVNCVNFGTLESTDSTVGGIVARFGANKHTGSYHVDKCQNFGALTSGSTGHSSPAGGIVGYAYGVYAEQYPVVTNCYSAGSVTATATHASGILGYCNTPNATIHDNYVVATVTGVQTDITADGKLVDGVYTAAAEGETIVVGAKAPGSLVVYWNNERANDDTLVYNNYYAAGVAEAYVHSKTPVFATDSDADGVADKDKVDFVRLDKSLADAAAEAIASNAVASGEVAYKYNTLVGATVLSQKIGTEAAPVFGDKDVVYLMADGSYSNTASSTTPDTTEPGSSTPTGDSAIVFAAIALISILGVAVVAKNREN